MNSKAMLAVVAVMVISLAAVVPLASDDSDGATFYYPVPDDLRYSPLVNWQSNDGISFGEVYMSGIAGFVNLIQFPDRFDDIDSILVTYYIPPGYDEIPYNLMQWAVFSQPLNVLGILVPNSEFDAGGTFEGRNYVNLQGTISMKTGSTSKGFNFYCQFEKNPLQDTSGDVYIDVGGMVIYGEGWTPGYFGGEITLPAEIYLPADMKSATFIMDEDLIPYITYSPSFISEWNEPVTVSLTPGIYTVTIVIPGPDPVPDEYGYDPGTYYGKVIVYPVEFPPALLGSTNDDVDDPWWYIAFEAPLWVYLLVTLCVGAAIGGLIMKRRRRR